MTERIFACCGGTSPYHIKYCQYAPENKDKQLVVKPVIPLLGDDGKPNGRYYADFPEKTIIHGWNTERVAVYAYGVAPKNVICEEPRYFSYVGTCLTEVQYIDSEEC
jgi:hypothetical protein